MDEHPPFLSSVNVGKLAAAEQALRPNQINRCSCKKICKNASEIHSSHFIMQLHAIDYSIMLIHVGFVVGIGFALKR